MLAATTHSAHSKGSFPATKLTTAERGNVTWVTMVYEDAGRDHALRALGWPLLGARLTVRG